MLYTNKHTEVFMMKYRKNGNHSNQQPYSSGCGKFPDAKESVIKYCSSMVIGYIDAYLYHMGEWC
jgi:hypothetical protein